ncbi:hypothetical protein FV139_01365 [Parahaliea maris]|uniref:Uncharacterized protein n=1 Tax=Parahaliea maris TaxID=2716870 RepID=A0A5C9A5K2_9GAMM|nr:hypothetical protein [Parahaliea maris]TXS96183.1 hypothetical protein FV139_01365 [Parahaliea maris]
MNKSYKPLAVAIAAFNSALIVTGASAQDIAAPYSSPVHVFSIDDLQSDFDGATYGGAIGEPDARAICGLDVPCPAEVAPFTDKQGVMLYPVDTEFGFNVVDFLGAQEKSLDNDYQEGFVGNITEAGELIGLKISNAATDTYKVKPPLGTWCQGLGGTSIKCSTEHYTVMEHVLSCHEVVPYFFADPTTGTQAVLSFPDGSASYDCAGAELDDLLNILVNGEPTGGLLTSATPGDQIAANDNTTVLNDIATSTDYSVTLKDDGKPLYRWGSLIKRPNDVRLYARIPLPEAWKEEGANYQINSAKLVVTHWITNNPNDQLRPEDLENESATGRKPSYEVTGSGDWVSTRDCYEGDGDYLESEEGSTDPSEIGAGTVLKNSYFADPNPLAGINPPQRFSADLVSAYTNAYYTTIDRDPFEWSYVAEDATDVFNFTGYPLPLTPEEMTNQGLRLVSGPRWRLKANKFGQDIPGLEIPLVECSAPPFSNDNIKYEVGTPVTTVINLLDWEGGEDNSPLRYSQGWIDLPRDEFGEPLVTVVRECDVDEDCIAITSNGLPMTTDFDLAVYIKGDRKSTALYSAQLVINEFEEVVTPITTATIQQFKVPSKAFTGDVDTIAVKILIGDNAPAVGDGSYVIEGSDGTYIEGTFDGIEPGQSERFTHDWTAPDLAQDVEWTVTVTSAGEVLDSATATTVVRVK